MKYISLDIETTDTDISSAQVLQVGMIVDDLGWPETVGDGPYGGRPYLEILCDPLAVDNQIKGSPFALATNAKLLYRIADGEGIDYNDEDAWCREFILKHSPDRRIVPAGKNAAGFDIPILKSWFSFPELFSRRVADPGMLYFQPGDTEPPGLSLCKKRAGLPEEVAHTACADAWDVIQLLRKALVI